MEEADLDSPATRWVAALGSYSWVVALGSYSWVVPRIGGSFHPNSNLSVAEKNINFLFFSQCVPVPYVLIYPTFTLCPFPLLELLSHIIGLSRLR
jgi:hypothetical protein